MRKITYAEAIRETLEQEMKIDNRIFVMGEGVDDPKGIFGTTLGLWKKFGRAREFDTPLSENGMTGVAIGAALAGMRPVIVHARMDFMLLAMDQIVNHAAKWHYMFGGKSSVPIVIRSIIGRGWGQGAQHSQSLQALFMHIPGLKVVMPSTPYDVKGLLVASINDGNPVIFIEHRWLYNHIGEVPKRLYSIPIGKGTIIKKGKDVTVIAISYMVHEAITAATILEKEGIDIEIVDLRSLRPIDEKIIFDSVKKTGRLVIADTGWKPCGVGAEISALVSENIFKYLKTPIRRISLMDIPTPTSSALEKIFYPSQVDIISTVRELMSKEKKKTSWRKFPSRFAQSDSSKEFQGPF